MFCAPALSNQMSVARERDGRQPHYLKSAINNATLNGKEKFISNPLSFRLNLSVSCWRQRKCYGGGYRLLFD